MRQAFRVSTGRARTRWQPEEAAAVRAHRVLARPLQLVQVRVRPPHPRERHRRGAPGAHEGGHARHEAVRLRQPSTAARAGRVPAARLNCLFAFASCACLPCLFAFLVCCACVPCPCWLSVCLAPCACAPCLFAYSKMVRAAQASPDHGFCGVTPPH